METNKSIHTYFRFYGSLNDFLPVERRQTCFMHCLKEQASVKDTIEALGIPHPEVDLILVNGEPVDFSYLVHDGDRVSVYPLFTQLDIAAFSPVHLQPLPRRFVLDVHLGKLAAHLRLLGFDTLYRNDYSDAELAQISSHDQRILLTQDRALLKRRIVVYGYLVRSHDPQQQLLEILDRFDLSEAIDPLSRCLRCNGILEPVSKDAIYDRLPPLTREHYDEFSRCQSCHQLYWKGAHYNQIQYFIDRVLPHEE